MKPIPVKILPINLPKSPIENQQKPPAIPVQPPKDPPPFP